ncbi:MAG: ADP-ribosyltransferase [Methanoregula sp.]
MPSPKRDPLQEISRHFDCSDTRNVGKKGLTYNNIRVIFHYTGQSGECASDIVNPILRSIANLPENKRQNYFDNLRMKIVVSRIQTFVKQMDDAISKIKLPTDLILYRGIDYEKVTDELGSDIEIGMIIRDAGYMSTSYKESVASRYAVPYTFADEDSIARKPLFVIMIMSDQYGLVSHHECEVILPRGSVIQCLDIIDVYDRRYFIMDCLFVEKGVEV